jgi:hypothetical protein
VGADPSCTVCDDAPMTVQHGASEPEAPLMRFQRLLQLLLLCAVCEAEALMA